MDGFWQDIRHAVRLLGKNPGFTAVAVATLALGIGANTAIFSIVDAVLLRPLPYAQPERLVSVSEQLRMRPPGGGKGAPSLLTSDTFRAWRDSSRTLDSIAAYAPRAYTLTGLGEPITLRGTAVSSTLFPMLRVSPEHGRLFQRSEERAGADQVAILSDALWTHRFGSDPAIVGRTIVLDDKQFTIVGVLPAAFYFPDRESEIWTPLTPAIEAPRPGQRIIMAFNGIARLKEGATIAQAEAEGTAVAAHAQLPPPPGMAADAPPAAVQLVPLQEQRVANVRPALIALAAAVGFVLLIASANIANLLLARGAARLRELAVRTALGAQRRRLLRQLLVESVLLALCGGAAGIALAYGLKQALPAIAPADIPRLGDAAIDVRVLSFACALAILTGVLFGLAPALQGSRVNVLQALNELGAQRLGGFRFLKGNRLRSLLVVAEVALSIVLLAGAGLLVRSFVGLMQVDPGYDPANVITAQVSPPRTKYQDPDARRAFVTQLQERIAAIPGVRASGLTNRLPLTRGNMILSFGIEGRPRPADPQAVPRAGLSVVSPGYPQAMGLTLRAGRLFTRTDRAGTPPVALVNESLAREYFPQGAVGGRLQMFGDSPIQIVGVVGDVRYTGLDAAPQPEIYLLLDQLPPDGPGAIGRTSIVVRSAGDPLAVVPFLRSAVLDVDPDLPLDDVQTMAARLSSSVAGPRFYALLFGLFALIALGLAVVGIYGVLSYSVAQRSREIGVRMALGAEARDVLRLVVGQGLGLTLAGIVVGLAGAVAATRFLRTLLFGVSANDPATYLAAMALLTVVALGACWIPARRAVRVDPMTALRYE